MQKEVETLTPDPHAEMARQQAAIVTALNRAGGLPGGFKPAQFESAAVSLARKRARAVQQVWPVLAQELGDFVAKFAVYAAEHAMPARGANQDGYAFARWLKAQHLMPEEAKIEFAIRQVSFGFPVRLVWLHRARSLALVYRIGGAVRVGQLGSSRRTRENHGR